MKFLNASNKIKILALFLFTVIIALLSFLLINTKKTKDWFEGYGENPYDENVFISVRVSETRQSEKENKTDYESSYYNAYIQITKIDASSTIENIVYYVSTTAENNVRKSVDNAGSTTKDSIKTSYTTENFTKFAEKKVVVTDEKTSFVDEEPENLYVRVTYTKVLNKETTNHELKYFTKLANVKNIKENKIEEKETVKTDDKYKVKNTNNVPFDLSISKTKSDSDSKEEVKKDSYAVNLTINLSNLGTNGVNYNNNSNKYLPEMKVEIFAKTKELADKNNFIPNYVRLASFVGTLTNARSLTINPTLDERYEVEEIYVFTYYRFVNGEETLEQYKIKLA